MPQPCSVCQSGLRALIESRHAEGLEATAIHRGIPDSGLSVAAVRRHLEAHFQRSPRGVPEERNALSVPETLVHLDRLAHGAEQLHASALASGNSVVALRSAAEARAAYAEILKHTEDVKREVIRVGDLGQRVINALARAADDAVDTKLAAAARELGDTALAGIFETTSRNRNTKK